MLDFIVSNTTHLHGQTLAALSTTTGQNGTTAFSGHTSAKAVGRSTLMLIRLVSALHGFSLSFFIKSNSGKIVRREYIVKEYHM